MNLSYVLCKEGGRGLIFRAVFIRTMTVIIFMLFLYLVRADLSSIEYRKAQSYSELTYDGEGYLYSFPEECSQILNAFAEYASNITMCSIQYARPIRLCEKCIAHYTKFQNKYQELLETVVNGTTCRSIFISHDRLDAILAYHDSISDIWSKGNCNDCFEMSGGTPELSNSTKRFNKMFNATMNCIIDNLTPAENNSQDVCEKCMESYVQLDKYYKTLSTDSVGVNQICMDIVDSMNTTRSIWSKSLNCCKLRRSPQILFLCCTGIIAALPLLFYVAVRYCGPIRDLPNVLKQSRFKQTILGSRDRRINS